MAELLLELLSEEIPARMQTRASEDLKRLVCDGLKGAGLSFAEARAYATPRRLALVIDGIPAARADVSEEKRGPRVGAPEQAVQGFLKGAGLTSLDQAEKRDTGKGEFWFAVVKKKGGPTAEALPGIIDGAMKALPWPKSMKWGSSTATWVRPLKNILCLFDGRVVPGQFVIGMVRSKKDPITGFVSEAPQAMSYNDITIGHRFLSSGSFAVTSFADYAAKLRAAHVVIDPAERRKIISEGAEKLCSDAQVSLRADAGLMEEVVGLVEWPVPLLGTIDVQFMGVPPEVLVVSMKNHQRYFATTGKDGALAHRFVVIANNAAKDGGKIITDGNERVLRARLSDAKFFWDQDRRTKLRDRLPVLDGIVFHAKLGTQGDRVRRIVKLSHDIAAFVPGADIQEVNQAAHLCKADLVSGMVGEFPELQGIMGRYYALDEKLPAAVADAIGDHYAPAGPNDRCPSAPVSVVVALADKGDLLRAFWSIKEMPTGSRDPYALRRAALGIIRIILENRLRLRLDILLDQPGLLSFLYERFEVQLRAMGIRHDVINAARFAGFAVGDDLVAKLAHVTALQSFLDTEQGKSLTTAFKRVFNILRSEENKAHSSEKEPVSKYEDEPQWAMFELEEERALSRAQMDVDQDIERALEKEDFERAFASFATLRAPVDAFFEKVTVNVSDKPELRLNRLRLLNRIRATSYKIASLWEIEG